jgi:hypothetical protein
MKGIYLTEEGKQEIEAKIAELDKIILLQPAHLVQGFIHRKEFLKEILSSAIVLPVEESWERLEENLLEGLHENTKLEDVIYIDYPKGVIIQPKQ